MTQKLLKHELVERILQLKEKTRFINGANATFNAKD